MVYILPNTLVLHDFSSKVVKENLGQIKGSALHKVFQDKLVSVKQEVIRSLLVNDGFVDNLLKDFGLAQ